MTPEQKCVSLGTAKKLQAAGFPQDTERMWSEEDRQLYYSADVTNDNICVAAPDAQEIGEFLRHSIRLPERDYYVVELSAPYPEVDGKSRWKTSLIKTTGSNKVFLGTSEAECRAACWLWLKENKLI